jgi:membrane peptidoglycan carboxypeptidase
MGYTDAQRSLPGTTGGSTPAQAWADFMRPAMKDLPVQDFPPPAKLVAQPPPGAQGNGPTPAASPAPTGPPDTTVKAPAQSSPSGTPQDCGGPCQLYSGPLDLPLTIQNAPAAAPAGPSAAAPPTASQPASSASAASPPDTTPTR